MLKYQLDISRTMQVLWYKNPSIEVSYDSCKKIVGLIPLHLRTKNRPAINFPTCLCKFCGRIGINTEYGFTTPLRSMCGKCELPPYTMREALRKVNTYSLNCIETYINIYALEFYEVYSAEMLEAFKVLNPNYNPNGNLNE